MTEQSMQLPPIMLRMPVRKRIASITWRRVDFRLETALGVVLTELYHTKQMTLDGYCEKIVCGTGPVGLN